MGCEQAYQADGLEEPRRGDHGPASVPPLNTLKTVTPTLAQLLCCLLADFDSESRALEQFPTRLQTGAVVSCGTFSFGAYDVCTVASDYGRGTNGSCS